jgi:hypothetical protein
MPPLTFDVLAFNFCMDNHINPLEVRVGSEGGVRAVFEDKELVLKWREFHRDHAKLRLISKIGNLKIPKERVSWKDLWNRPRAANIDFEK